MDEITGKITRDDIDKKIEEIAGLTKARLDSSKTEIAVLAFGSVLLIAGGYWLGKKRRIASSSRQVE